MPTSRTSVVDPTVRFFDLGDPVDPGEGLSLLTSTGSRLQPTTVG